MIDRTCVRCSKSVPTADAIKLYDSRTGSARPIFFCTVKCRNLYLADGRNFGVDFGAGDRKTVIIDHPKRNHNLKLTQKQIRAKLTPKEADISRSIGGDLTDRGIWNTRTQSGAIKTEHGRMVKLCRTGTPDRLFAAGLHVWIEVKRPGETSTPDQVAAQAKLKANGALCFVLDDPGDVPIILNHISGATEAITLINRVIGSLQYTIDAKLDVARSRRKK